MTRLFQLRRYPELAAELPSLNDKLSRLSKSEIGLFIGEFYQVNLDYMYKHTCIDYVML